MLLVQLVERRDAGRHWQGGLRGYGSVHGLIEPSGMAIITLSLAGCLNWLVFPGSDRGVRIQAGMLEAVGKISLVLAVIATVYVIMTLSKQLLIQR